MEDRTAQHPRVEVDDDELLLLVVVRGPNAGSRYAVQSESTTIGRHPDSDVFLDDVTVSRRHAEVRNVDRSHQLVDVGSLNGTYVNGERIDTATIRIGDQLQIGKFKFVVVGDQDD
jgi:pSer/pThr/pTyr-binding forkhead associated (FHA) protein